nr:MAG TPA: Protein of unknown function (DUF551) [Caudoviricetes sp.]
MDIINESIKISLKCCVKDNCNKCNYLYSTCYRGLARDALEQIEDLEAIIKDKEKSPWISVEEMLPIIGEKVVVSDGVHTWDYGQYKGFLKGNKHEWWWKNMTPRTVHWWMPKKHALPEPPEEEEA